MKHLLFAITLVLGATVAARADDLQRTNTGLDLTQPLTSLSYTFGRTIDAPGIATDSNTVSASYAWASRNQFSLFVPYRSSTNFNTSGVSGAGSVALQYDYVLPQTSARYAQAIGTGVTLKSGAEFGSNQTQIAPLYELSYRASTSTQLILRAQYAIGTDATAGTARYNDLSISPYAIFDLPKSAYVAVMPEFNRFSGDLQESTYATQLSVGKVIYGKYNLSAYYGIPLNGSTYDQSFNSRWGLKLALQQ